MNAKAVALRLFAQAVREARKCDDCVTIKRVLLGIDDPDARARSRALWRAAWGLAEARWS